MTLFILRLTSMSFSGDIPCANASGSSEKALQKPLYHISFARPRGHSETYLVLTSIETDGKLLLTTMRDPAVSAFAPVCDFCRT